MTTGYKRHFDACNRHDPGSFVPFVIGGKTYGHIKRALSRDLLSLSHIFAPQGEGIALNDNLRDFTARSEALAEACGKIAAATKRTIRGEMYPILHNWGDEPLAQLDRSAVPWFGVHAYGVHINGFVRKQDGIHMWVGERSSSKLAHPGKLDNIVGGGQPIGLTIEENLYKEASEEADIPPALMRQAKPVRTISYRLDRSDGMRNDTLFVYDLELPEDFMPRNTDGEVSAFYLMPMPEVAALVYNTDRFKFNCNLVIIDFLMRHGQIDPEHPEHEALCIRILQAAG